MMCDWLDTMQQEKPASKDGPSASRYSGSFSNAVLIGGGLVGVIICYLIAAPFVPALIWSLTLAVLFVPFELRVRRIVTSKNIAAGISSIIVALIVVIPVLLIAGALSREAIKGAASIATMIDANSWSSIVAENPVLFSLVERFNGWIDFPQIIQEATISVKKWSGDLVKGSVASLLTMLVTFYFLFYFLRDSKKLLLLMQEFLPFNADEFAHLKTRVADTIFASVYGTLVVSALQGILGGLMFWWLGLPSPLFWGVLMGAVGIVPFLGAFIIWVPAAIFLVVNGNIGSALILTFWGTIVVGLVDNVIYPILVGNRLKLHSVPAFVAILGGLLLFGPSGIVLGPVIIVIVPALFNILRDRMLGTEINAK